MGTLRHQERGTTPESLVRMSGNQPVTFRNGKKGDKEESGGERQGLGLVGPHKAIVGFCNPKSELGCRFQLSIPRSPAKGWAVPGLVLHCRGVGFFSTHPSPSCMSHLITPVHLVWAAYSPPEENSHLINFRFKATRSPYIKNGVGGRTAC